MRNRSSSHDCPFDTSKFRFDKFPRFFSSKWKVIFQGDCSAEVAVDSDEEPLHKRRKTYSGSSHKADEPAVTSKHGTEQSDEEEDTIPFRASEYESIPCSSASMAEVVAKTDEETSQPSPRQLSDVEYENAFGQKVKNR